MDRNKQREIARKGGRTAHARGAAHEWSREEAREAGRKGGLARSRRKQTQPTETPPAPQAVPEEHRSRASR